MPYDIEKNRAELEQLQQQHKNDQSNGFPTPLNKLPGPDLTDIRHNYNTYRYDYFSGSQAKVYFGDVLVDDIVTLSYAMRQTKEPIYGYASQKYDAVAMGTIIGEGSLTIAFKEVGYLNVIQSYLDAQREGIDLARENVIRRLTSGRERNISQEIQNTSTLSAVMQPNLTPSLVRRAENIESILDDLKDKSISPFKVRGRTDGAVTTGAQDFDDMAELLEDTIWGDHNGKPFELRDVELKRADEFDYRYKRGQKVGIKAGDKNRYRDTLNIMVTFGDINDFKAEHTMVLLNDVHFNSHSMVFGPTGDPIGETYNFFFHDMNKALSKAAFNISNIKLNVGTDEVINLPRQQDIEYLNELIGKPEQFFKVDVVSAFRDGAWTNDVPFFFQKEDGQEPSYGFKRRDDIPYGPQLTKFVEETVTEKALGQPDLPEKLLIKIEAGELSGIEGTEVMHFILDKGSDFSSLYTVTTPTKNDFYAVNLVQREDFFFNPSPPEPILERKLETDATSSTSVKDPETGEAFSNLGSADDVKFGGTEVNIDVETGKKVNTTNPQSPLNVDKQKLIDEQESLLDEQYKEINAKYPPITKEQKEGLDYLEQQNLDIQRNIAIQTEQRIADIRNQAILTSKESALHAQQFDLQRLSSGADRGFLGKDRYNELQRAKELQQTNKNIIEEQSTNSQAPLNTDQQPKDTPYSAEPNMQDIYYLEQLGNQANSNFDPRDPRSASDLTGTNAPGYVERTASINNHKAKLSQVQQDYGQLAEKVSQDYPDIDKETLLAIIYQESKGDPYARPPIRQDGTRETSARGLGQFITSTGEGVGFKKRPSNYPPGTTEWDREVYSDWYDPNKSVAAIAQYTQKNGDKKWLQDLKYSNPKAYQQVRNSFHHSGPYGQQQRQGKIDTNNQETINWLSNVEAWKEYYKQSSQ